MCARVRMYVSCKWTAHIHTYLCVWMSDVCYYDEKGELYMFLRGAYEDTLCACSVQLRYI